VCLRLKPTIPNSRRREFDNANDRVYAVLLIMQILLQRIWSNNGWAERLRDLLEEHPKIPLRSMGFPPDWLERKEWALAF